MSERTIKIICRNIVYNCTVAESQPYKQPTALNWRYQVPGKIYNQPKDLNHEYQKPRAINWRWQPPYPSPLLLAAAKSIDNG